MNQTDYELIARHSSIPEVDLDEYLRFIDTKTILEGDGDLIDRGNELQMKEKISEYGRYKLLTEAIDPHYNSKTIITMIKLLKPSNCEMHHLLSFNERPALFHVVQCCIDHGLDINTYTENLGPLLLTWATYTTRPRLTYKTHEDLVKLVQMGANPFLQATYFNVQEELRSIMPEEKFNDLASHWVTIPDVKVAERE